MTRSVRVGAALAGALILAGCGSWAPSYDWMPSMSPPGGAGVQLRLESEPPGAEARTSLGPACRTPCTVNVPAGGDFSVSFALTGYLPQTVSVRSRLPQDMRIDPESGTTPTVELSPNPVAVALDPAPPPAPVKKKAKPRPAKPRPPKVVQQPQPAAPPPPSMQPVSPWPPGPGQPQR